MTVAATIRNARRRDCICVIPKFGRGPDCSASKVIPTLVGSFCRDKGPRCRGYLAEGGMFVRPRLPAGKRRRHGFAKIGRGGKMELFRVRCGKTIQNGNQRRIIDAFIKAPTALAVAPFVEEIAGEVNLAPRNEPADKSRASRFFDGALRPAVACQVNAGYRRAPGPHRKDCQNDRAAKESSEHHVTRPISCGYFPTYTD